MQASRRTVPTIFRAIPKPSTTPAVIPPRAHLSTSTARPSTFRWQPYPFSAAFSNPRRCASTSTPPPQPLPHRPAPHRNPNEPVYELTFTCKACRHRSAHTVSKQGYHKGTVLITCPGCSARHLISDHLHIFSDTKITLEDILKQKGVDVQKGAINSEGDIEFYPEDKDKPVA